MPLERLDKIIASQGELSRADVKKLLKDGLVAVNGTAVHDVAFKADVERDEISVRGKPIRNRRHIYIMLNKPAGVISASRGAGDTRKTVTALVPVQMRRLGLFPAGRLDADSTGV
ncbi:MAG: rRNA pseudouridine synthase, partial [Clostridiales bacterium]|nr:rRNA pseudouridine synthase [Clostridiales bacterium]